MSNILVTASTGFIGRNFFERQSFFDHNFFFLQREIANEDNIFKFDLRDEYYRDESFQNIDIVIHIAGQSHVPVNTKESLNNCIEVNFNSTVRLAKHAERNGVKKFVFLSSIKAAGLLYGKKLTESQFAKNIDIYGRCKKNAEEELMKISKKTNMKVSIIRSSLVYGPYMKGNLRVLHKFIAKGLFPKPKMGQKTQSMVHVFDLIDALIFVAINNKSNDQIYNLTDNVDYSLRDIYDNFSFLDKKKFLSIVFPKIVFLFLSIFGSLINYFINFPFTYSDYEKLFKVSTFSSKKIRELGFKTKYDFEKFMTDHKESVI